MINVKYKLTSPLSIETFCEDISWDDKNVIVRPERLSICKADLRYYFGMRDAKTLRKRLPLTLIHEAVGQVLYDSSGQYTAGEKVILLPNIPGSDERYSENYRVDSLFCSSRSDGFMQEMVAIKPQRLVPYSKINDNTAAIIEFISVGVHAVSSYFKRCGLPPNKVAVWGNGALGYVVSCLLKYYMPKLHLTIVGTNRVKLNMFSFADERLTVDEISEENSFDDVFECVGGQASGNAMVQIIDTINPEGNIMLLGVSEEPIPVNTRMVLEKGLSLVGRSRSTREDFEEAVTIMENNDDFTAKMSMLVSETMDVCEINDIHKAFSLSQIVDFKLIMNWNL